MKLHRRLLPPLAAILDGSCSSIRRQAYRSRARAAKAPTANMAIRVELSALIPDLNRRRAAYRTAWPPGSERDDSHGAGLWPFR